MELAVKAEDVSKVYKLYDRPADRLFELFLPTPRHTVFPALQSVSFEIPKGETIGLIGQNGAGKSTLLKLLCGVTTPSSGSLETKGTIASILELGTGFHPEFTGRDNAALNAAILGLSPAEIKEKLPAILEFSELGAFLDQPVKTYSSGMYMRLAFSVAVNVDPEVLIIDEALAVGDGHFQKKCVDKIREFQQRGRTIIFCSHALYYISTLCHRTIWLDQGTLMRYGPSIDVVHEYETFLLKKDRDIAEASPAPEKSAELPIRIRSVEVLDSAGRPRDVFATGDEMYIRAIIDSDIPQQPIHLLAGVERSADDMQCFVVGTHNDGLAPLRGQRVYDVTVKIDSVPLQRGDYTLMFFVGDESAVHIFDRKDLRPGFSMGGERYEVGLVKVKHSWSESVVREPEALVSA